MSAVLGYWIAFGLCQVCGFVAFQTGNVHTNTALILAGAILLLPGDLFSGLIPHMQPPLHVAIILAVNFGVWWWMRRAIESANKRSKSEG